MESPRRICHSSPMLAQIRSGAILGVDAYVVRVEVDFGRGLPGMQFVGLPESAVREGRDRVQAALHNTGFAIPSRRITVNLAPADVPKSGSAFDLPVALGILGAAGELALEALSGVCVVGELGLDGTVRPVRGVLSIADRCTTEGIPKLLCPPANAAEARAIDGLRVVPVATLDEAVAVLCGRPAHDPARAAALHAATESVEPPPARLLDFADVKGQDGARRGLEIAAAGQHNLLLVGPPGSGKSMLARRLPSILPPLRRDEAIAATRVHSVVGGLRPGQALLAARPFRAPHHTVSDAGLVGGGNPPRPGEASLAHTGVLFLDELPEFRRSALEALRQPLEEGVIRIGRARIALSYPARFTLVAAMNPCPCGFHGSGAGRCVCRPSQVERYVARMSGPLLDRIDLHIEVPPVSGDRLVAGRGGEPSVSIRERVLAARERQTARFRGTAIVTNGEMDPTMLRVHCRLDDAGQRLMRAAVNRLRLSGRAYHRVLRVARTVADLDAADRLTVHHLAEAVQYRTLDRPRTRRP
jgi:magnesium chelatase family protein